MSTTPAKKLELLVERVVMGSRWLQAPLYIGLVFVLVVMHMAFVVSALLLTYIDKIASDKKGAGGH